jgi:hypothetical protein
MDNTPFRLSHPIPQMGSTPPVSSIEFRRPKLKDLRNINRAAKGDDEMEQAIAMIVGCTFLTPDQAGEIDSEDLEPLMERVPSFFPQGSPKTKT